MLTLEVNKHQLFITNITELKGRYTHLDAEFQRIARRDKKVFLSDQYKEIEENNRMGKTRVRQFNLPHLRHFF